MSDSMKREGAAFLCEVKGPILFTTLPCGLIIAAGPEQEPVAIFDGEAHAIELREDDRQARERIEQCVSEMRSAIEFTCGLRESPVNE